MIVVDASVAAKCFIPEEGTETAIAIITGVERMIAPELICVEVSNAICRRAIEGKMATNKALSSCEKWREKIQTGVITLIPNIQVLSAAEKLAIEIKHPIQDCIYLALAISEQSRFVTADDKFKRKLAGRYLEVCFYTEYFGH
jgi:predicted nucleic acid-binding protein